MGAFFERVPKKDREKVIDAIDELQWRTEGFLTLEEMKHLAYWAQPNAEGFRVVWSPNQIAKLRHTPSGSCIRTYLQKHYLDDCRISGEPTRWPTAHGIAQLINNWEK